MAENVSEIEGAKQRLAWYARQPGNAGLASDVAILLSTIEKQQKVVEVVKARIVLMRECAEADLLHVEGLHRAAPARAIREADKALAALEGKP